MNQMEIGLTKELEITPFQGFKVLEDGRVVIQFCDNGSSIRAGLHSGDGLDSYYFDIPDEAVLAMAQMINDRSKVK